MQLEQKLLEDLNEYFQEQGYNQLSNANLINNNKQTKLNHKRRMYMHVF